MTDNLSFQRVQKVDDLENNLTNFFLFRKTDIKVLYYLFIPKVHLQDTID